MNCAYHPEVEHAAFCIKCGKPLCAQCVRQVQSSIYCEGCVAGVSAGSIPPSAAPPSIGGSSPEAAFVLGLIPGVGAIYNGEYIKALFHLLIFGGIISLGDQAGPFEGLFAMLAVGFYFYMIIDSYQTARRRAAGQPAPATSSWEPFGFGSETAAPIGPLILIVLGALFLMNTLDFFPLRFMWKFWPAILIAVGVWMLWKRTGGESR